jgi:acyl-coenzyme A synthetase/AMP-(fatty) acid ligase/acyl carrier protein
MVPLCHGATVVIAGYDEIQQPLALFETVKRRRATVLDFVPSYWENCLDFLSKLDEQKKTSLLDNQLRLIVSTGEPLLPHLPLQWGEQLKSGARLVNMFGQTETTGTVATYPISSSRLVEAKTVPIGGPIADTDIYLLDGEQRLVPIETEGEIYVGGAGVGLGYLNQPELTAEKFVPNPFSPTPGTRLYRTGDVARFRADGEMEFVSRSDDQVKIRGIRIELGEVRSILSQHPDVRQSAVVAVGDHSGGKRLVAYVAPRAAGTVAAADLRSFLKQKLPDYMIPATFVIMDALPLTASGKINRQGLPAADYAAEESFVAPRSPVEEGLAAIWAEVLGLERIGVRDDFFELGGHSLAVSQIISRIDERFNLQLPLKSLFDAPTVEEMAVLVAEFQAKKAGAANLESMLAELESLSDEEAEKLVSRENP